MAVQFIKAFAAIQAARLMAGLRPKPGPRIDENLPLGLRIGSSVLFENDTLFILAEGAGHQVRKPALGVGKVAVHGSMSYGGGYVIHRFYLEEGEYFIQAIVGADGKIADGELRLYQSVREWMPATPEEWTVWLPGNPDDPNELYAVGYKTFGLPDAADLTRIAFNYTRMWPSPEEDRDQVIPVNFEENLNADPYGADSQLVVHRAMLYGRVPEPPAGFLPGTQVPDEWLWLCVSEFPEQALVTAHVGLTLAPGDLRVVPPSA